MAESAHDRLSEAAELLELAAAEGAPAGVEPIHQIGEVPALELRSNRSQVGFDLVERADSQIVEGRDDRVETRNARRPPPSRSKIAPLPAGRYSNSSWTGAA